MRAFDHPDSVYAGNYAFAGLARIWYLERPGAQAVAVPHIPRHSPNGLAWGYTGNGAADTALAILTHATTPAVADRHYQAFTDEIVAALRANEAFRLEPGSVTNWLTERGVEPELTETTPSPAVAPERAPSIDVHEQAPTRATLQHRRITRLWDRETDLNERERRLDQREMRLDERAAALRAMDLADPAWHAPAEPIRAQIEWLLDTTGDRLSTVALGLGVEAGWAADVLSGSITKVDIDHVQRLCEALHCNPYDLWDADTARSLLHAYGPELWPADMFVLPNGFRDHTPIAPTTEPETSRPTIDPPGLDL